MGKSSGSAPTAPDPYATANAASGYSKDTALFNANLNRYNTITPYGSQTWSNSGGGGGEEPQSTGDASQYYANGGYGGGYGLGSGGASSTGAPNTQTISLAPAQQQLLDSQNSQNLSLSGGAMNGLTNQINQNAGQGTPDFNSTRNAAQNALYSNQTQYLDPQFKQQQTGLESQLANQGVTPGTEAYDNAMGNFNRSRNQAYGSAMNSAISGATGQQTANIGNWATLQNQPINQLAALRGNTQVQNPNFQNPSSQNAQTPDFMSAANNQYQGQLSSYNANQASNNATMGGLFGLGGTLGAAALLSDARVKYDVKRIGETSGGVPLYSFKYLGSNEVQIGVIAQEADNLAPGSVKRGEDGYLRVDYSKVH